MTNLILAHFTNKSISEFLTYIREFSKTEGSKSKYL